MARQAVIPGAVNEQGRFDADDEALFRRALTGRAGKRTEVVLRDPKSKRSLEMNAYLHCQNGPFRLLAEHLGDSIESVKYDLAGECFGWVKGAVSGNLVPAKPHTSEWTVEESAYFVDWVIPWAAQHFGVVIPLPNETDY